MRSGARFGVVLHAERAEVVGAHALEVSVVEVQVGNGGAGGQRLGIDRVVVVLAGDLDAAGREVAHRMIAAVMTEPQLERRGAERERP